MKKLCLLGFISITALLRADPVTYNDRSTFESAVAGSLTLEDFTDTTHFPLPSGVLNSASTEAGLSPGEIEPGVTYTTPVGESYFFNIDGGGDFVGGFLDGFDLGRTVTATFATPVSAFGFDTNCLMPDFWVKIIFSDSSVFQQSYLIPVEDTSLRFFGFASTGADIVSAEIGGSLTQGTFGFAFDNFTFGGTGVNPNLPPAVPDSGSTTLLLGLALGAVAFGRRFVRR